MKTKRNTGRTLSRKWVRNGEQQNAKLQARKQKMTVAEEENENEKDSTETKCSRLTKDKTHASDMREQSDEDREREESNKQINMNEWHTGEYRRKEERKKTHT